jgi:hypothetical protein
MLRRPCSRRSCINALIKFVITACACQPFVIQVSYAAICNYGVTEIMDSHIISDKARVLGSRAENWVQGVAAEICTTAAAAAENHYVQGAAAIAVLGAGLLTGGRLQHIANSITAFKRFLNAGTKLAEESKPVEKLAAEAVEASRTALKRPFEILHTLRPDPTVPDDSFKLVNSTPAKNPWIIDMTPHRGGFFFAYGHDSEGAFTSIVARPHDPPGLAAKTVEGARKAGPESAFKPVSTLRPNPEDPDRLVRSATSEDPWVIVMTPARPAIRQFLAYGQDSTGPFVSVIDRPRELDSGRFLLGETR